MIFVFQWRDPEHNVGSPVGLTGNPSSEYIQKEIRAHEKKGYRFVSICNHPTAPGYLIVVMRKEHS